MLACVFLKIGNIDRADCRCFMATIDSTFASRIDLIANKPMKFLQFVSLQSDFTNNIDFKGGEGRREGGGEGVKKK